MCFLEQNLYQAVYLRMHSVVFKANEARFSCHCVQIHVYKSNPCFKNSNPTRVLAIFFPLTFISSLTEDCLEQYI